MGRIFGAQAQIDEIHMMIPAPLERAKNHTDVGREPAIKHFNGEQFGVRNLFVNGARHSGAVP